MTDLTRVATDLRCDILRMIAEAKSGHPGGSLSCTDILTSLYFGGVLKHDPKNPKVEGRRLVLFGKGPCGAGALRCARPCGLFPSRSL